jgi:hypothetical protein
MKLKALSLLSGLFIVILISMTSCGSSKKVSYTKEKKEIKMPLSGSDFRTNGEYFRVVSHGESPDLTMAEKIAMSNARAQMAMQIQTLVKAVNENYSNQIKDDNAFQTGQSFESLSRDVANQILPNIAVKESKVLMGETNIYEYWVCVEISKKDLKNRSMQQMTSGSESKILKNKETFQRIFDEEMNKLN